MSEKLELCPGRWIGDDERCFIIAEIGQNHQGDINIAKTMIDAAKVMLQNSPELTTTLTQNSQFHSSFCISIF